MYDILTIGSATRDVFLKTKEFKVVDSDEFKEGVGRAYRTGRAGCFMLGSKIPVYDAVFTSGGAGTNVAVTFARQDFKISSIIRVGNDSVGQEIVSELEKEGVDVLAQKDKDHNTDYSTILVSPDGERTILAHRGAGNYINFDEIDLSSLEIKEGGWLYIDSLGGNENLLAGLLGWAKKNKLSVAYNPGKKMLELGTGLQKYLDNIDIFSVNEDEAAFVAGIEYSQEKEDEIFDKLDSLVKGIVIMSKGPRGVEVSDNGVRYSAGIPDSLVIDRTGAGDAFSSGFVSGYIHSGGDIANAIQLGTANASSVVEHFGAKEGILKKGDWGNYDKIEVIRK